ncbi:MAG: septum formation initiator family protein [bacterium]
MKKFQEKKKFRDILQSKPVLILFGIILIAFSWNVWGLFTRMQETAKNTKIERDKITELQQRKEKLSEDIANLKTEKGMEENIRDKFGFAKEGEGVVVIVDDKDKNLNEGKSSDGFFSFFKKIFK